MNDPVIVLSNAGSRREAEGIAHALVNERLAACVNIVPRIHSVYRWRDEVEIAEEWMMWIKTTRAGADSVIARLTGLHSYELPAAIILPIEGGHGPYLDWIAASVTSSGSEINTEVQSDE